VTGLVALGAGQAGGWQERAERLGIDAGGTVATPSMVTSA
jgi:hypothetical protein